MNDASSEDVFQNLISSNDTFLFDCDGVLWKGAKAVPGAAAVVNFLENLGKQVIFVTNNSTKSRDKYVDKLSSLGYPSDKEKIFGTAYTSALYLKHIAKIDGKVYLIGNESMGEELDNVGIKHFGIGPDNVATSLDYDDIKRCKLDEDVNAVLVGFDGHISFSKLVRAGSYLRNPNCLFLATNSDARLPLGDCKHVVPGTGVMVASVCTVAAREPDVWCGKPGKFMFECIQKTIDINPDRAIMIGDNTKTDIVFGKQNSLKTLLVFSGVSSRDSVNSILESSDPALKEQVPDYVLPSLGDWAEFCS
uniref:Phosphoglycolate phosphatase-like n=1 Tax=Phallusia mammillata TaxID=59560 RepID=A0A6F9DCT3_9ASCI|nr:phosphoglycolate phosphatase-like [Phallusia mammillata]